MGIWSEESEPMLKPSTPVCNGGIPTGVLSTRPATHYTLKALFVVCIFQDVVIILSVKMVLVSLASVNP